MRRSGRRRRLATWALCWRGAASLSAPARRAQHFINLTNGLEAIDKLGDVDASRFHFCRIQSSHCEANDFEGVLWNLDHNLLAHLALGSTCYVYDFGSRSTKWPDSEVRIPRAVWWGCEWSRYALSRLWRCDVEPPSLRGYTTTKLFDDKIKRIPKPLAKRLKYYRKFDPSVVDLRGVYYRPGTNRDGDDDFYADKARLWAQAFASEDLVLPPDFAVYNAADWRGVGRASSKKKKNGGSAAPPDSSSTSL